MMDSNGRAPPPDNDLAPGDNAAGFYDLTTNHIEATISRKVANTLKKASAAAALAAEIEVTNKITCLHFECVQARKDKEHENKVKSSSKNPSFDTEFPMNIGEYVTVKPDLSAGKNSYSGLGWISDATRHNQKTYYTIRYIEAQGR